MGLCSGWTFNAVLEVDRDASGSEGMIADPGADACCPRPPPVPSLLGAIRAICGLQ